MAPVKQLVELFQTRTLSEFSILAGIIIAVPIVYSAFTAVYNLFFHPLRHIPGPKSYAATRLPYVRDLQKGVLNRTIKRLHDKYGEVVRVAPDEVSFISGETAWQDIYGFHSGAKAKGKGPYLKDISWFTNPVNGVFSIIAANEADHSRERRALAHAFSDKALKEQEPLLQGYVDLLINRLREESEEKGKVDMAAWYNFTTFDIIADLTFGEALYCLRDRDYHPWVRGVFGSVKGLASSIAVHHAPLLKILRPSAKASIAKRKVLFDFVSDKVDNRLSKETARPDFMTYVTRHSDEKSLTRKEIHSTSTLIMIAGSETTATMLSGTTYALCKHPEILKKVTEEVRQSFKTQDDITIDNVNKLSYMIAVLSEGLRIYPPVPTGFPRIVPAGGDQISGYYIPERTSVYMSQYAANRSTRNFTEPESFIPERWLDDPPFPDDNKAAYNPFSFGPRNCLGKNLAYAEMRLIMAKVLFNFDLELAPESTGDWFNQKVFVLWQKPPLMVKLKSVRE